jgi:endonuclease YncB( thermonuclease family)
VVQRDALLRPHKTDPYGRLVAVVSIGDADVGLAQVRAGLAWHFKRYAK